MLVALSTTATLSHPPAWREVVNARRGVAVRNESAHLGLPTGYCPSTAPMIDDHGDERGAFHERVRVVLLIRPTGAK
jgi:hypothetical protein